MSCNIVFRLNLFQYLLQSYNLILYFITMELDYSSIKKGINYAIPNQLWNLFIHKSKPNPNTNYYTSIIDTLILDFEQDYVQDLSSKLKGKKLTRRCLSPSLLLNLTYGKDYIIISSSVWHQLRQQGYAPLPIMVFALNQYANNTNETVKQIGQFKCVFGAKQLQIFFQSSSSPMIYIGYLPNNISLKQAIQYLLIEFSLIQLPETKLRFVQLQNDTSYGLKEVQKIIIGEIAQNQTFILVNGLLGFQIHHEYISTSPLQTDVVLDRKTVSTGLSTPMSFSRDSFITNHNRQLQMLVCQKSSEEISDMKMKAKSAIEGGLIMIQQISQIELKSQLELLSQQLIFGVQQRKKMKEKDI